MRMLGKRVPFAEKSLNTFPLAQPFNLFLISLRVCIARIHSSIRHHTASPLLILRVKGGEVMNKKRKQQNKEEAIKELEELDALGFHVVKYTDVHWRIFKDDYDLAVDVWPTTKKLMPLDTYKSRKYEYLAEEVSALFKSSLIY